MIFLNQFNLSELIKNSFKPISQDIWKIIGLSLVINILIICPTWYMLQVYSRVITSKSETTLMMLTLLILGVYALLEAITYVRAQVMYYLARQFEASLSQKVFDSIFLAKSKQSTFSNAQSLIDLRTLQDLLISPVFLSLIDAPIAIAIILIIFLYDPLLGWLSIFGAISLGLIALFNYKQIYPVLNEANKKFGTAHKYAQGVIQNAQVIEAMGMLDAIHAKWKLKQMDYLSLQTISSNRAGLSSSVSKVIQMLQGSLTLGLGSWLVLKGYLAAGSGEIIVNSMLASRALAPLVTLTMSLKVLVGGQDALKRLDMLLKSYPELKPEMPLPPPQGHLVVDSLSSTPPGSQNLILQGIAFELLAGQSLAIVGPSASGKTSLARLLTGIWAPSKGSVRLDGVDIYAWNKEELGPHVGYLPQSIELFDGTIADNIARFSEIDMAKVEEAANIAGIHNFIMSLEGGYSHAIGNDGAILSGGQRQRVALARAIYGLPKYIVLDEPNSNLDEEGELALVQAVKFMKSKGSTIITVTHRPQITSIMDYMLLLINGQIKLFGPTNEVVSKINASKALLKAQHESKQK